MFALLCTKMCYVKFILNIIVTRDILNYIVGAGNFYYFMDFINYDDITHQ